MPHRLVRLDNVWGAGGGLRPVKALVQKMTELLQEYLVARDVEEARRCLMELEVPHFHHELVYEAVVLALEKMTEPAQAALCELLAALYEEGVLSVGQMTNGFLRVFEVIDDIAIDVPAAFILLEKVVNRCRGKGILTEEVVHKCPHRGRKRFVSEGDGGRLKNVDFTAPYV